MKVQKAPVIVHYYGICWQITVVLSFKRFSGSWCREVPFALTRRERTLSVGRGS